MTYADKVQRLISLIVAKHKNRDRYSSLLIECQFSLVKDDIMTIRQRAATILLYTVNRVIVVIYDTTN